MERDLRFPVGTMTQRFGKYEVVRRIGGGGYGAVYEALDPAIGRRVAIKTCAVQDEEARARFVQEARLAGNLHHRNLTTLYDFGSEGGLLYLVSEFLPGEDLDALLASGRSLSTRERVEILIGLAYGLGHAHDAGVVHRDVKPGNIRILPDGTVKIMDFGIAKFLYAERTLTRTGFTVGTSSYLSPEQVRGDPVDRRTDVYAFGVVAYELLSARKPFSGATQAEILDAIAREEPVALSEIAPRTPPDLVRAVERAMSKNPSDRYPSMDPIRRDLLGVRDRLLAEEGLAANPVPAFLSETALAQGSSGPPPSRFGSWIVVIAILATLAAACALLFWLGQSGHP